MDEKDKKRVGWECPKCGSVNSPDKDKCQCPKEQKESATPPDPRELLQE